MTGRCATTEDELQTKSNALLETERQLADNQAELAKMWAELGQRTPAC